MRLLPASAPRGFTLLELMIVILIFVMVAMLVVPAVEGATGIRTREEAGKLAGTIRAMYGEAVLSGKTCRLVMDLDERAYWPECGQGRVKIRKIEESIRGIRVDEQLDEALKEDEDEEKKRVEARNAFGKYEAGLAPKRMLPEGVVFEGVWTQHQEEPYVGGQAYLYFFPHGQTEKAYVWLGDGSDTYTVMVKAMTGRTSVAAEKVPVPDRDLAR